MAILDYLQDNIATRGIRPLAALADYYMSNSQQPPAPPAPPVQEVQPAADTGYQLTPEEEAMYAQSPPKKVVQFTPEELAAYYASKPQKPAEPAQETPIQKQVAAENAKPKKQGENVLEEYNKLLKTSPADARQYRFEKESEYKNAAMRQLLSMQDTVAATLGEDDAKKWLERNKAKIDSTFNTQNPLDTEEFKTAVALGRSESYKRNAGQLSNLKNILESADSMLKSGANKDEVSNYLSVNVPKILLSVATPGSSEALQIEEAFRTMPEMQTLLSAGFNINQLGSVISKKELFDVFTKQPEKFMDKASKMYNAVISTHNGLTDLSIKDVGSKAGAKAGLMFLAPMTKKTNLSAVRDRLMESKGVAAPMRSGMVSPVAPQYKPAPPITSRFGTPGSVNVGSVWPQMTGQD
ncbi:hypothetical protein UFOVP742_41 [uncultured Caudovirales phage]|uniref:Uncharacterized protein n=1 Tax=uncultured Caudovirales phage TaxID=2100421 RepID=A0A6J7X683_9CAUD|nr:hypothetical protein UFOVP742_41 [uncultured Caudovirales phage]